METLDTITQIILSYAPSIVAIITMICTVITSVKKISSTTKSSLDEVKIIKEDNEQLKAQMAAVLQENMMLKETIDSCINKLNHVAEVDDGSKR